MTFYLETGIFFDASFVNFYFKFVRLPFFGNRHLGCSLNNYKAFISKRNFKKWKAIAPAPYLQRV